MSDDVVAKYLNARNVRFVTKPHKAHVFTCEDAARERGVRLSQIVKCMVGRDEGGGLHVMLIPGDRTLKVKKVRKVAGGLRIELLDPVKLAAEFGLTIGAISPTQLVGKAQIYMDTTVLTEEYVDISSGSPASGIELKAQDLKAILNPILCEIISDN